MTTFHQAESYQSIFWEPDWVFEKYHGWKIIADQENLRVFLKCIGPFKRYLILSKLNHNQLRAELDKLTIFTPLSMVIVKDFSEQNQEDSKELNISGYQLPKSDDAVRLLNKYTFVIDLFQSSEKIWTNFNADNKRVCKKALAAGMFIEATKSPTNFLLKLFFKRYKKMATERSLTMPSETLIRNMFEDGHLTMYYAKVGDDICTMILVYSVISISFFFYGVAGDQKNDGSAQLLHWKVIEHLKQTNQHWYDLGGVPKVCDLNGIYRFKKSFGGVGVDLGPEYCYYPIVLKVANRLYKKLRAML